MRDTGSRSDVLGLSLGFIVLALLAVAVSEINGSLVNTLGVAVVASGLFLAPARTAIVAGAAVGLAVALVIGLDLDHPWFRVGNVVLASLLGVGASWALDRRVRSIDHLRKAQERIFDSMPDAVIVLDNAGVVTRCNDAARAMIPGLEIGARVHPLLDHHVAADGPCPGGCVLDVPTTLTNGHPHELVAGESINSGESRIQIGYTAGRIDEHTTVVSLRDITPVVAAEQDRRALLAEAARQHEQQRLVEVLSSPARDRLPATPGLATDAWSVNAGAGSATGGDLIDVSQLPDGRVLLLVVDALGEGVLSVRDAWKVLYVSRALMMAGVAVDDLIVRATNTLAQENEPAKASLLAAIVDPHTGDIELASAGHPPGLIVRANGSTQWLEATGRGIGMGSHPQPRTARATIEPGDTLVLYTDGMVDGTRDIIEGLAVLRSSATALRARDIDGWARGLLQAVLPADVASGDATLLAVRLNGQSASVRQTSTTR